MNLGYACINMTLSGQKPKVTTNRSMIKKTFTEKGVDYAGELGMLNVDLGRILRWNVENGIKVFRLSSEFFRGHQNISSKIYHNISESKLY